MISLGLNERGSQVSLGLNPFIGTQTIVYLALDEICFELLPMTLLEFTTEGYSAPRMKRNIEGFAGDLPVEDSAATPFEPTGVAPQADPPPVVRPTSSGQENTLTDSGSLVELVPYVPGQPEPQVDPAAVMHPVENTSQLYNAPGGVEYEQYTVTGLEPQSDPPPVVGPK